MKYTDDQIRNRLRQCYDYAKEHSQDPVTQNGALLTKYGSSWLVFGANRFPRRSIVLPEWKERPLKYERILHAEEVAILEAGRRGICTQPGILFCPWASCISCALRIIESGITTLIRHEARMSVYSGRWTEEIFLADSYMIAAGIEIITWSGTVGNCTCLVNGETWNP